MHFSHSENVYLWFDGVFQWRDLLACWNTGPQYQYGAYIRHWWWNIWGWASPPCHQCLSVREVACCKHQMQHINGSPDIAWVPISAFGTCSDAKTYKESGDIWFGNIVKVLTQIAKQNAKTNYNVQHPRRHFGQHACPHSNITLTVIGWFSSRAIITAALVGWVVWAGRLQPIRVRRCGSNRSIGNFLLPGKLVAFLLCLPRCGRNHENRRVVYNNILFWSMSNIQCMFILFENIDWKQLIYENATPS